MPGKKLGKKLGSWMALLLAAAMLLSLSACGTSSVRAQDLSASYSRRAAESGAVTEEFKTAFANFSFALLKTALSDQSLKGNKLLSPLSAAECLALAANGAGGETKAEMEAVLGLTTDELNKALYAFSQGLAQGKDEKALLANSVWLRNDGSLQVKEDFLQTLADWYAAEIYAEPFTDETVSDINDWCAKHTDNMIRKIVDSIKPNDMLFLLNALVFDAKWEEKYKSSQILTENFTNADGSKSSVTMLSSTENLYLSVPGGCGVAKPYADSGYYFVGLLPENAGQDIREFAASLTGEEWLKAWDGRSGRDVRTKIPEFKTEDATDLTAVLKSMGMTAMFDESKADFQPLAAGKTDLYVSGVQQMTYLELDRDGTRAAAVTGMTFAGKALPMEEMEVYLDRPFVYLIIDGGTGLPLFTGVTESIAP